MTSGCSFPGCMDPKPHDRSRHADENAGLAFLDALDLVGHRRGWWRMPCWNGLSTDQQTRLIEIGTLEIGYQPEGLCERGAEIGVETQDDAAPGPRFYCRPCAIDYLNAYRMTP